MRPDFQLPEPTYVVGYPRYTAKTTISGERRRKFLEVWRQHGLPEPDPLTGKVDREALLRALGWWVERKNE